MSAPLFQSGGDQDDTSGPRIPRFDSLGIFKGSIEVENKGSVARDHMANERTFLAWLRTSLSFITIGIGITQLFKLHNNSSVRIKDLLLALEIDEDTFNKYGKSLGGTFIGLGIVTLVFGFTRFFKVQHLLTYGYFPATKGSLLGLVSVIFLVLLSTLIIILKK